MGIEGQFHTDTFLIKIFDDFVKITASNSVKLGPKFQGQFRPTPIINQIFRCFREDYRSISVTLSPKFPTARSISNVLDVKFSATKKALH